MRPIPAAAGVGCFGYRGRLPVGADEVNWFLQGRFG